jgi:hypothetical protein
VADRVVFAAVDARRNHRKRVSRMLIGHDLFDFWADIFLHRRRQRLCACVWNVKKPQVSTALANAHYNFLVLLASTLSARSASDPSFIYFHNARELWTGWLNDATRLHSFADAMSHIPRRPVTAWLQHLV